MSALSTRLSERALARCDMADGVCELAQLCPGTVCTVEGFDPDLDPATSRRMFDLGFVPGAEVEVVRRAPLRDPIVYRVADYEIALRRAQARTVRVRTQ